MTINAQAKTSDGNNDERESIVSDWITAANTHDPEAFIAFFDEDAILDDPSVGEQFQGHEGITEYYSRYFIGYNTTTALISVTPEDNHSHVVVDFTGDFPGGRTAGIFNLTFLGDMIIFAHADLA